MAATNIFYRIPSQPGTKIATIPGTACTLQQFRNHVETVEGLDLSTFLIACNTKLYKPGAFDNQSVNLLNNSQVDIIIPLLGGKGGFGSLLRAIGAQIEKTTNRDACRDLSGRRLRDIKREEELKKLIALQERLIEERKRRRKEKLEKLKKRNATSTTSASIQELVAMFDDHDYNRRRLELGDILEAAVDKGIINFKKRQESELGPEDDKNKKLRLENMDEDSESGKLNLEKKQCDGSIPTGRALNTSQSSRIKPESGRTKLKKNDLWLGIEDEEI